MSLSSTKFNPTEEEQPQTDEEISSAEMKRLNGVEKGQARMVYQSESDESHSDDGDQYPFGPNGPNKRSIQEQKKSEG